MFYFQKNIHNSFFHFIFNPFLLYGISFHFFLSLLTGLCGCWLMNKIKRNKRFIMLYSHYTIYLFELFQVEGERGRSSSETTSSELSSDDLATKLKRLEISSRGRDDETFFSPDTGSLVSSTSDETQPLSKNLAKS